MAALKRTLARFIPSELEGAVWRQEKFVRVSRWAHVTRKKVCEGFVYRGVKDSSRGELWWSSFSFWVLWLCPRLDWPNVNVIEKHATTERDANQDLVRPRHLWWLPVTGCSAQPAELSQFQLPTELKLTEHWGKVELIVTYRETSEMFFNVRISQRRNTWRLDLSSDTVKNVRVLTYKKTFVIYALCDLTWRQFWKQTWCLKDRMV